MNVEGWGQFVFSHIIDERTCSCEEWVTFHDDVARLFDGLKSWKNNKTFPDDMVRVANIGLVGKKIVPWNHQTFWGGSSTYKLPLQALLSFQSPGGEGGSVSEINVGLCFNSSLRVVRYPNSLSDKPTGNPERRTIRAFLTSFILQSHPMIHDLSE